MKYIKKIFEYLYGRRMDRYEEDQIEIVLNEILSILIMAAVVLCVVYMLTGFS